MNSIKDFLEYSFIGIIVIIAGLIPRLFIKRLKVKYLCILAIILIFLWEIIVIRMCIKK